MLIFRYLAKEVLITLAALTGILLLIFMSNQFVRYLNRAASGQIPFAILFKLMMLELPNLMGYLLPLGFYMALLLAYGRLYADSEMTVLRACGYGPSTLLRHTGVMALAVSCLVATIVFWGGPAIALKRAALLRTAGIQTLIQTLVPGRFTAVSKGKNVFYVDKMDREHTHAHGIFLAQQMVKQNKLMWRILSASNAQLSIDPDTVETFMTFKNGHIYEGIPGHSDYQHIAFETYKARLPHPTYTGNDDIRTVATRDLWPVWNGDTKKAAELQWRCSVPLMVFTLALLAIPLSRVNPRSGKFAALLPAILLYIVYANLMFISRDWVARGVIPVSIGMWWIHGVMLVIALVLLGRQGVFRVGLR